MVTWSKCPLFFGCFVLLFQAADWALAQPPGGGEGESEDIYCFEDKEYNNCADAVLALWVEEYNGVSPEYYTLACGACPTPPQGQPAHCPNANKVLVVGDLTTDIRFAVRHVAANPGSTSGKKGLEDGDPIDCGTLNTCASTCTGVYLNGVLIYGCNIVFVSNNMPVQERWPDGDACTYNL